MIVAEIVHTGTISMISAADTVQAIQAVDLVHGIDPESSVSVPDDMLRQDDPIGTGNTVAFMLHELSQCEGPRVACWGRHGTVGSRGKS